MLNNQEIGQSMTIRLQGDLPPQKPFREGIRRAPKREFNLSESETLLALKNALRYIPPQWHEELIPEFLDELFSMGRIYGYRFRPEGHIKALPITQYKGNCLEGKAFQLMIDNNLDFDVALYPYELVTYGETGQVCQNWMQYCLLKQYLETLTDHQTLVVASGHPLGLFHSQKTAPRAILTNGLLVGMFDDQKNWHRGAALGITNYGQMTAGGWMYIGPQGIVHGTFNTLLNAGRSKLGLADDQDLAGVLFVSSGLGGMSGAQGKAAAIAGGVALIAEVDLSRIETRKKQGWVQHVALTPEVAFQLAKENQKTKQGTAIAFHGNIIDLLLYAVETEQTIDLLSDQTSCHAVYDGGYCPQGLTYEMRTKLLSEDKEEFRRQVDRSLCRHYELIKALTAKGTYFFDYGNSFLKAVFDAGAEGVCKSGKDETDGFVFPSYVEDILGPRLFDYGYGPFRWICLSGDPEDLKKTDKAAMDSIDPKRRYQDRDNYNWIRDAEKNHLVVGSQARILYQDAEGRRDIALRFNQMVRNGECGPIMLGRDHHDTGGTDSPFRETSDIKDGSNITADMATHIFAGNCARGMSLVALHNGGGVGIGKSINGGFGMVLDGSLEVDEILRNSMPWDVMGGVARRAWARNENAIETSAKYNQTNPEDHITLPYLVEDERSLTKYVDSEYNKRIVKKSEVMK